MGINVCKKKKRRHLWFCCIYLGLFVGESYNVSLQESNANLVKESFKAGEES